MFEERKPAKCKQCPKMKIFWKKIKTLVVSSTAYVLKMKKKKTFVIIMIIIIEIEVIIVISTFSNAALY